MKQFSLLLLLTLTACGGKKSSKVITDALASANVLKAKVCACKEPACMMPLMLELKKWGEDLKKARVEDKDIAPEQEKQLDAVTTEIQNCIEKVPPDGKPPAGSAEDKPEPTEHAAPGPKGTEAMLMLNRIGKNSKVAYITNAEFIKGKAGTLPDGDCCKNPGGTCAVTEAWSKDPVWQGLDFSVDEPGRFHYAYESDGKTFTATAVGDPACSGQSVTYTVTGNAEGGNPQFTIKEP